MIAQLVLDQLGQSTQVDRVGVLLPMVSPSVSSLSEHSAYKAHHPVNDSLSSMLGLRRVVNRLSPLAVLVQSGQHVLQTVSYGSRLTSVMPIRPFCWAWYLRRYKSTERAWDKMSVRTALKKDQLERVYTLDTNGQSFHSLGEIFRSLPSVLFNHRGVQQSDDLGLVDGDPVLDSIAESLEQQVGVCLKVVNDSVVCETAVSVFERLRVIPVEDGHERLDSRGK